MNKLIGGFAVSINLAFAISNETIGGKKIGSENIYRFSRPSNLYIPLGTCILAALVSMLLAWHSLYKNGVPATEGIIQSWHTGTGNGALHQVAAAGSLGGARNASQKLREKEVGYGELHNERAHHNGQMIRMAGFGTSDEIVSMKREDTCGVVG